MKDTRILFMGTATFSSAVLEKLIENKYNIIGVVTQPDRLVGRKKELKMPEVKEVALKHDLTVIQPTKIKEDYQAIIDLQADIIITAAYGQIIPEIVLNSAKIGAINVHASLLPQYRGGAPVHYAIMEGNKKTGVTIMYMVKKMDAGNIISQREVEILPEYNTGVLYELLSDVGADLLIDTLPSIIDGTNESIVQDEAQVTYASIIKREDEKISFNNTVEDVANKVRGLNPWPGSYTTYLGKTVKVWQGHIHNCQHASTHHKDALPGQIVKVFKDGIAIKCLDGIYIITDFQLEGKKRMLVADYLHGKNIFEINTMFE